VSISEHVAGAFASELRAFAAVLEALAAVLRLPVAELVLEVAAELGISGGVSEGDSDKYGRYTALAAHASSTSTPTT
jgi:hypothetical protein